MPDVSTTQVAADFMTSFPIMKVKVLMDALKRARGRTIYRWILVGTHGGAGNRVRINGYKAWRIGA